MPAGAVCLRPLCKKRTRAFGKKRSRAHLRTKVDCHWRMALAPYLCPGPREGAPPQRTMKPSEALVHLRKMGISFRNFHFKTKLYEVPDSGSQNARTSCRRPDFNPNGRSGKPVNTGSAILPEGKGFEGRYKMVQGWSRLQRKWSGWGYTSAIIRLSVNVTGPGQDVKRCFRLIGFRKFLVVRMSVIAGARAGCWSEPQLP